MSKTEKLIKILTEKNKTIATMESCTGGGVVNNITNIPGASKVLKYSAVTYSDEYKIKMGVSKDAIEQYGVYSIETAENMSKAISNFANSDYGIGITGLIDTKAYISIYIRGKDEYLSFSIDLHHEERSKNKEEITDLIITNILDII